MKKLYALVLLLVGPSIAQAGPLGLPQVSVGCPYVIEVENKLPNAANLISIKARIVGLPWNVIEDFGGNPQPISAGAVWNDDYKTSSACNTTRHDFQLKFRNAQNVIKTKRKNGIKVKNGTKVKFVLGQ